MIESIPFLSSTELADLKKKIFDVKVHWRLRDPRKNFYALGPTSYAEAQVDFDYYSTFAHHTNPILEKHFGFLYRKLEHLVKEKFGQEVFYDPELSLPGFHMMGDATLENVPHVDAQYLFHPDYKDLSKIEDSKVFTFTAAIAIPSPCGIRFWKDFKFLGYHDQGPRDFLEFATAHQPEVIEYQEGYLYLHRGHLLHQLQPARENNQQFRITFQGHCIISEKGILAYF